MFVQMRLCLKQLTCSLAVNLIHNFSDALASS
jgi:hypothetical protein